MRFMRNSNAFRISILLSFLFLGFEPSGFEPAIANDSITIKVHFLYGSKPAKQYKDSEPKWFGGKLGGHVGIEVDSNRILNFIPQGEFHWFEKKKDLHSTYVIHDPYAFWSILGGDPSDVKKTTIIIPISQKQKSILDSLSEVYLKQTPYDYALFGMRCGAASYEILGQMGILKSYSHKKTYKKIFYPKLLREKLLELASRNGWTIIQEEGSPSRKWEKD